MAWEYQCVPCGPNYIDRKTKKQVSLKNILAAWGSQGWELVQVLPIYHIGESEMVQEKVRVRDALNGNVHPQIKTLVHNHVHEMIVIFKRPKEITNGIPGERPS